jgi:hypothetical protein
MKKYLLAVFIVLTFVCTSPHFAKAIEAELTNSDIRNFINALITIKAIPPDKIAEANAFLAQLDNSSDYNPASAEPSFDVSCAGNVTGDTITWTAYAPAGIESVIKYKYSWADNEGSFAMSQDQNVISKKYTTFGTKTAYIYVKSVDGFGWASCNADILPIDIIPAPKPPTAYVSCVANPSRAPIGSTINWSAIVYGGEGTYTYAWSDNEGSSGIATGSAGQTVSKIYNTAGIKTATLLVKDSENNNATIRCNTYIYDPGVTPQGSVTTLQASCFSDRTTVYLGPKDLPPITKGGNIVFTAKTSGGDGGYTYLWSDSDGDEGLAGENLLKVYTTPGNKSMNVKVTSGTQTVTKSCNFNVVDTPPPPLTTSCSGVKTSSNTVVWHAVASGGGLTSDGTENYAYLWWLPNEENSVLTPEKSVSKVYTTTGSTTAYLKVYSGDQEGFANCSANVSPVAAPLSVSCSATPDNVSPGQLITWTANPVGGIGNYLYYWWDNESYIGEVGSSFQKSYASEGEKIAGLLVTSSGTTSGSPVASTICYATVASSTTSTPTDVTLSVSCSANPSNVSTNEQFTVTATPVGGTPPYTYLWSDNQGTIGDNSQSITRSYTSSSTQNFLVQVTSGDLSATNTCPVNITY